MSVRHGSPVWPAVVLAALTTLPLSAQRPARADETLVIRDTTVIDGTGAPPRPHTDVYVRDGRIAAILAPGESAKAKRTIRCEGRWIMPGCIDAHAHFGFGVPDQDFVTESRFAAMGGTTTVDGSDSAMAPAWNADCCGRKPTTPNASRRAKPDELHDRRVRPGRATSARNVT